jgi:hypothetical protein
MRCGIPGFGEFGENISLVIWSFKEFIKLANDKEMFENLWNLEK